MMKLPQAWFVVLMGMTTLASADEIVVEYNNYSNQTDPQTIVGGNEIVPGSRPYLVSLGKTPSSHSCGGSVITPNVVLTAAHCHYVPNSMVWDPLIFVNFGRHSLLDNTGVVTKVLANTAGPGGDIVIHPSYPGIPGNDLSLIFLPSPIKTKRFPPVILNADPNVPNEIGSALDLAGWGSLSTRDGPYPNVPSSITTQYLTNDVVAQPPFLIPPVNGEMYYYNEGHTACSGDSGSPVVLANPGEDGGPLTIPPVQVGIHVHAFSNCNPAVPISGTRVSFHLPWITGTVCARTGELCSSNTKASKVRRTKN